MKHFAILALLCTLGAQAVPDRTPYIINGHSAPHQPFNAYVQYLNAQNAGFFGGGSIISDRHILTSAQNIQGFVQWDIGLGTNIFTQLQILTTTMATAHPNFNSATRVNDIGVITLVNSLIFTTTIAPISLPALAELNQLPLENEQGTILGFGFTTGTSTTRSDFLMRTFKRVITNTRCQGYYNTVQLPNHFCAEDNIELSNICQGDIGAGFVTNVRGTQVLTGIASMITASCSNAVPSGYTRVIMYRQWIQQTTGV